MKIVAFAAGNSRQSINRQLVSYATSLLKNADIELLDLNDYELPLFSVDRERELGESPALAQQFYKKIGEADALIISFPEHNGSYTAAYKNLFDWTSRIDMKVYQGKPMVLLATSPGPGGAKNVLEAARTSAPFFDGEVRASLSVPSFQSVFDSDNQVLTDEVLIQALQAAVDTLI